MHTKQSHDVVSHPHNVTLPHEELHCVFSRTEQDNRTEYRSGYTTFARAGMHAAQKPHLCALCLRWLVAVAWASLRCQTRCCTTSCVHGDSDEWQLHTRTALPLVCKKWREVLYLQGKHPAMACWVAKDQGLFRGAEARLLVTVAYVQVAK